MGDPSLFLRIFQEITFLEYRSITIHRWHHFPPVFNVSNVAGPYEIRRFLIKILL